MIVYLSKSTNPKKKYMVKIDKKSIHFGASGYSDYTIHKDLKRRLAYILRHKKNEKWDDIKTAGFWSLWLLWNKSTLEESIDDIERRFNITILWSNKF